MINFSSARRHIDFLPVSTNRGPIAVWDVEIVGYR